MSECHIKSSINQRRVKALLEAGFKLRGSNEAWDTNKYVLSGVK